MMKVVTTRFGEIEVSEDSILHMPDGMLGFPKAKRFVLLEDQPNTPYKWLQSVDDPSLAFIVINPLDFVPDYDVELDSEDADVIKLTDPTDAALLTTVTVDKDNGRITTNLLGPVIINSQNLHAKQIVLNDEKYGIKHLIAEKSSPEASLQEVAGAV